MELLALCKPIKKPPRSDERDGELFCGTSPSFEYLGAQNGGINLTATVNVGDYIIHCASGATKGLAYTGMDLIYEYAGEFRSGGVQVRFTCFIATSTTITVNSQSAGGGLVFKMTF